MEGPPSSYGWWTSSAEAREFYVNVAPEELEKMVPGVAYALVPANSDAEYQWKVVAGVTVTRP